MWALDIPLGPLSFRERWKPGRHAMQAGKNKEKQKLKLKPIAAKELLLTVY